MNERYTKLINKYEGLSERSLEIEKKIQESSQQLMMIEAAMNTLFGFNEHINKIVKDSLESIANCALKIVFPDKRMFFRVCPRANKKGVYYDLRIETDGTITDLLEAKGGGVLDVIQMCLRVTYLLRYRGQVRQTLVLDEPFKNLDSERVNAAASWLKKISDDFNIQFVIITHIPALTMSIENNGNVEVRYADGMSHIVQ